MRLSSADQEWLWLTLAEAARREAPLSAALAERARAAAGTRRGEVARKLAEGLGAGLGLREAVAGLGLEPTPGTDAALAAGEQSGRLADVLESLAAHARFHKTVRLRIIDVLLYPLLMAAIAVVVVLLLQNFFYGYVLDIFREFNIEVRTAWVMVAMPVALPIDAGVTLVLPALILAALYVVPPGALPWRTALDRWRLRVPFAGRALRSMLLARWCQTMGILTAAGVPESAAVRLAGGACGNRSVEKLSENVARDVDAGRPLAVALEGEVFFPGILGWMVDAAAASGGHQRVWATAGELYGEAADAQLKTAGSALGILFFFLGLQIILTLAASMFVPLLDLMQLMGNLSGW